MRILTLILIIGILTCECDLIRRYALVQRFPGNDLTSEYPLTVYNNKKVLMSANDGVHGKEPWVVDIPTGRMYMLKDVEAGLTSSNPQSITAVSTCIAMTLDTLERGTEMWISSTGDEGDLFLAGDIYPGQRGSEPRFYTSFQNNTKIAFVANDGTNGDNLYTRTCIQTASVSLVKILCPSSSGCRSNVTEMIVCKDFLYLSANGPGTGRELWKSSGTASGTVIFDLLSGPLSSNPRTLVCDHNTGNVYFFATTGNGTNVKTGVHYMPFAGPPHVTIDVNDKFSRNDSTPNNQQTSQAYSSENLAIVKNIVYFSKNNFRYGYEPHVYRIGNLTLSNATSAALLHDIFAGKDNSLPGYKGEGNGWIDFDGVTLFPATSTIENGGRQLWATTGQPTSGAIEQVVPNITTCTVFFALNNNWTTCIQGYNYTYPECKQPMTFTNTTRTINYTLEYKQVSTVQLSLVWETINGTSLQTPIFKQVTVISLEAYNISHVYDESTTYSTNTYPCISRYSGKGDYGDLPRDPQYSSMSTFMYCRAPNNISCSPDAMIDTKKGHMLFRGYVGVKKRGLYVAVLGSVVKPPSATYPTFYSRGKFRKQHPYDLRARLLQTSTPTGGGVCKKVVDVNGFLPDNIINDPVVVNTGTYANGVTTTLAFFFASKGNMSGLWYTDVTQTPVPYLGGGANTCSNAEYEPNQCGKCAFPGDHISCRGLSCGMFKILDGCGNCVSFNVSSQLGFYEQCKCFYKSSFTPSEPGFGIYTFNNFETAVTNCRTKHLIMQSSYVDPTSGSPIVVRSDGMRISSESYTYTLTATLNIVNATNGFTLDSVGILQSGISGSTRVYGTIMSGVFKIQDCAFLSPTSVDKLLDVLLFGKSKMSIIGTTFSGSITSMTDPGYTIFIRYADGCNELGRVLNFSRNSGLDIASTFLKVQHVSSVWITNNRCVNCGRLGGKLYDLTGCGPNWRDGWYEIARNNLVNNAAYPPSAGDAYYLENMIDTHVYGNTGNKKDTCINMQNTGLLRQRGPPPSGKPWTSTLLFDAQSGARHIAYQNEACVGTGADIKYGTEVCDDLCGMTQIGNLDFRSAQGDVSATNPSVSSLLIKVNVTITVIHLEMGYMGIEYTLAPSTVHRLMTISAISQGLAPNGLTVTNPSQGLCLPEIMDRQYRCRQLYNFELSTTVGPTTEEVVGDFNAVMDLYVHQIHRMDYMTPYIIIEWFRLPAYKTRIQSSVATLYMDEMLTIPYVNDPGNVILEDTKVYLSVKLGTIAPELPDDRTLWHEIEIYRVVACFPNASSSKMPNQTVAVSYRSGPVDKYQPWKPRQTGCWSGGFGMEGPFTIFDTEQSNNGEFSQFFMPRLYRNPGQPISEQNLEFTMIVSQDIGVGIEMSITVEYNIIRKKFISRQLYSWPRWNNVSSVNQVDLYRDCPVARNSREDRDNLGLYRCFEPVIPVKIKTKEPNYLIFFLIAALVLMCAISAGACVLYELAKTSTEAVAADIEYYTMKSE